MSLDLSEKGRTAQGDVLRSDRRLFMQLLVFDGATTTDPLLQALAAAGLPAVLYLDARHPWGVGLLSWSEDPAYFVESLRDFIQHSPFAQLRLRPRYTMLGRTYALGYEEDLEQALLHRPREKVANPAHGWAVWYPLRRSGAFQQLPAAEQRAILAEHGGIGRAFGRAGLGTDIRLASFGLDANDNDFVIGLLGRELFPLSAIVERMRMTRQTSQFISQMGPFFVGKAIYQTTGQPS